MINWLFSTIVALPQQPKCKTHTSLIYMLTYYGHINWSQNKTDDFWPDCVTLKIQ